MPGGQLHQLEEAGTLEDGLTLLLAVRQRHEEPDGVLHHPGLAVELGQVAQDLLEQEVDCPGGALRVAAECGAERDAHLLEVKGSSDYLIN